MSGSKQYHTDIERFDSEIVLEVRKNAKQTELTSDTPII